MWSTHKCSTSSRKIEKAFLGRSEGSESCIKPDKKGRNILNLLVPQTLFVPFFFVLNFPIEASPCGISQRHDVSPATGWQLTLATGRSPRGCQWQGQGRGWCAVWCAPSIPGYCRKIQITIIFTLLRAYGIPFPKFCFFSILSYRY